MARGLALGETSRTVGDEVRAVESESFAEQPVSLAPRHQTVQASPYRRSKYSRTMRSAENRSAAIRTDARIIASQRPRSA